jgi:hypothetical protein
VRLVDYTFEPFSGRILLTSFLPAVDEQLNPVSLRITYEVDQGGTAFWVVGADGQFKIGKGFEIGGSAVTDRNPLAPYDLYSANAVLAPGRAHGTGGGSGAKQQHRQHQPDQPVDHTRAGRPRGRSEGQRRAR